jgi:hypothetical protein
MYARLRQKITFHSATTATTTSLGNNTFSLCLKDIGRLLTGLATGVNDLNSEIWDIANSEVVNTVPAGWSEYQTNFLTTSTNITTSSSVNNTNCIYLRCPSIMQSSTGGTVYKYTGLGLAYNSGTPGNNVYWNPLIPWGVADFTGSPTCNYPLFTTVTASAPRNAFMTNTLMEYIIYASPRCLFISGRYIGASATQAGKVVALLEYPATGLSQAFNLPNQAVWEISNTGGSTTTGTGAGFNNTAYNVAGGYLPSAGSDILTASVANLNLGLVYTPYTTAPTGGWNSLWSTTAGTADASTLKPATYTGMANTVDLAGNSVTVPAMPLIHYPGWDSVYDMSSLTGIYATKTNLGTSGDTLTLNAQDYAYVNATNTGFLVPRQ